MIKPSSQNKFLFAFLGLTAIAAILWCVAHYAGAAISPALTMVIRWAALIAVCGYAWARRSLTAWIFAGMLIGAEIGHDWPKQAADLASTQLNFSAPDQDGGCAAHFWHAGGGNRRPCQLEAGWAHGREGPGLF